MVKSLATLAVLGAMTVPAFAATQTFTGVPVIDVACSRQATAHPDEHTRACDIQCKESGFGIVANGKFLKLDAKGNKELLKQLKSSRQKDHVRVDVTGSVENDFLIVSSIRLLPESASGAEFPMGLQRTR